MSAIGRGRFMRLGVILTTSGRPELCSLSAERLEKALSSLRSQIPELKTFVCLADDGTDTDISGPWDLVIKHKKISGIQRSFSAAYAAVAPWTDIILHLEDDRPVVPERFALAGQAIEAMQNDPRIGAFCLFGWWTPDEWLENLAAKGCVKSHEYKFKDLDVWLMSWANQYPWGTFNFNCTLIRSELVRECPLFGATPARIGSLEVLIAQKVRDAGLFGAHSPQLHRLANDKNPGHSPGWDLFGKMGMEKP
jgi:hypothetical protein